MELEVPLPAPGPPSQAVAPPRSHALVLPDGLDLPEGTLLEIPLLLDEHSMDIATAAAHAPAVKGGAEAVHRWLRVFWPTDGVWYDAHVREFRTSDNRHRLWYKLDGAVGWQLLAGRER